MNKVEEYALKILHDHDCDEYTYGETKGETIINDLKQAYPNGMEFPYIEVCNAIIAISKRKPLERAPYRMIYDCDTGGFIDGIDCQTLEEAKDEAFKTLNIWMESESCWTNKTKAKQIEDWNYMIENDGVWVEEYDPETDGYEECWYPSDAELEDIGWKKIPKEEE